MQYWADGATDNGSNEGECCMQAVMRACMCCMGDSMVCSMVVDQQLRENDRKGKNRGVYNSTNVNRLIIPSQLK